MAPQRHAVGCRCTSCAPGYLPQQLRPAGERITAQRQAVWDWLVSQGRGMSAGEIASALAPRGIGQATVYRALSLLERHGLMRRISAPQGKPSFIAVQPEHSHALICDRCGKVQGFDSCGWNVLGELLALKSGYRVDSHYMEVRGLCPDCQKAR